MELLRIISMFMVVMLHTNFWALGEPTLEMCKQETTKAFAQFLVESIAIVSVNCFIFISGWFSIKLTLRGVANLLFLVVFYNLLIYLVFLGFGLIDFDLRHFISHCNFLPYYWFVTCYFALYLLSPILNTFIDNSDEKWARNTVLIFVGLDVIMGWWFNELQFNRGHSLLHFMVVYLIARYIKVFGGRLFSFNKKYDLLIYLLITLLVPVVVMVCSRVSPSIWGIYDRLLRYNSPFVMLASVYFSLYFTKLKFQLKSVNFIGASCFAVYLIHTDALIRGYVKDYCQRLFANNDIFVYSIIITLLIIGLFVVAVLVDQLRKWLWSYIQVFFPPASKAK